MIYLRFVLLIVATFHVMGFKETASAQSRSFSLKSTIDRYCVRCHGPTDDVGNDVTLHKIMGYDDLIDQPSMLEDLIKVIEYHEMPPSDEPDLPDELRESLLGKLQSLRKKANQRDNRIDLVPLHRMNRFQYHNSVTDLFQLKCIVFALPERMMRQYGNYFQPETGQMPDVVTVGSRPLGKSQLIEPRLAGVTPFPQDLRAEHGYDNRGDHLSLSPLLMQKFLELGQSITRSPDFTPQNVGIWNDFFCCSN